MSVLLPRELLEIRLPDGTVSSAPRTAGYLAGTGLELYGMSEGVGK